MACVVGESLYTLRAIQVDITAILKKSLSGHFLDRSFCFFTEYFCEQIPPLVNTINLDLNLDQGMVKPFLVYSKKMKLETVKILVFYNSNA